jgi:hypothetical protein
MYPASATLESPLDSSKHIIAQLLCGMQRSLMYGFQLLAASVRISGDVPALCAPQHLNVYVLCFSDEGPNTSPHPISQEELRGAFNPSDGMECRHHRTGPHSATTTTG